ncbi:MAG: hypothetical protein II825_01860 [Paludibacteraceae bacterium]|nr:hypothetical protein [Paludibacteraceae bacterium]
MHQHDLERLLIYTDKDFLDDFPLSQTEYNELYELFITTKNDVLEARITAVDFFNEVFYYITHIYDDREAAEHLLDYYDAETALYPPVPKYQNPKNDVDRVHGCDYRKLAEEAKFYIMDFVWFILNKQQQLPLHVGFFRTALNKQFDKDKTSLADEFRDFLTKHPDQYNISFTPHPECGIDLILRSNGEWQRVTLDFDRIAILAIVKRFAIQDRDKIVSMIKEAYLARRGEGVERTISKVTYQKRANENFLNNLAKEENLKALDELSNTTETSTQTPTPGEGFDSYIIKEHKKVLDILMLVAYMGDSQLALLIKFIKAFQQLNYIQQDCFEDIDLFIENAATKFPGITFDKANVRKYIKQGTNFGDTKYAEDIKKIAKYLQPLL